MSQNKSFFFNTFDYNKTLPTLNIHQIPHSSFLYLKKILNQQFTIFSFYLMTATTGLHFQTRKSNLVEKVSLP